MECANWPGGGSTCLPEYSECFLSALEQGSVLNVLIKKQVTVNGIQIKADSTYCHVVDSAWLLNVVLLIRHKLGE